MFTQLITAAILGILSGIFTGLIPGIHINLISVLIVTLSGSLMASSFEIQPICFGVFIIAMAVTHTFLDSIPGIYLGAPDESHILTALPGHRMLLQGKGHEAVMLTVIGSLGCALVGLIFFPLTLRLVEKVYPLIKNYIGYMLIIVITYMILKENKVKKLKAFTLFVMSGLLGLTVFRIHTLNQPLFPLLSGLFGLSILLLSLLDNSTIPKQTNSILNIDISTLAKSTLVGVFVASLAGFFPGFGSSQAAIIGKEIAGKIKEYGFLIMVGGINTVNMLTSIATVYVIDKARNGAIVAINKIIGEINLNTMLIFLIITLISAAIATILAMKISRLFSRLIAKINYRLVVSIVIFTIICITIYFDKAIGLLILITSTGVGVTATKLGIAKHHLMGCLILPVIFYLV